MKRRALPLLLAMSLACMAARAATDPADTVRDYYARIARHDWQGAFLCWDDHGRASRQTLSGFRHGFDDTAEARVQVGAPGEAEGAAGSSYVTVPVAVFARLRDGTTQHFVGRYTLRTSTVEPGRGWHLVSATLKPAS